MARCARRFSALLVLALVGPSAFASQRLLYVEAQAVGGYLFREGKVRWYSMHQMDVMQKPSIGFDLLQRLSSRTGDWGALAVQARLAYDETRAGDAEPQLYNAYLKLKTGFGDIWIGHNKPAFGLSSVMDNHGALLQPLSMYGFGYDRDWGVGAYRDVSWGNLSATITAGSGMPLHLNGNYLISVRAARGSLSQDNFTLGASLAYGRALETMGYNLMMDHSMESAMTGIDASWLWNNLEIRTEVIVGRQEGVERYAGFWRLGIGLMPEGRLRAELQPVVWGDGDGRRLQFSAGLSYLLTGSLTARLAYYLQDQPRSSRVIAQMYCYCLI